jgi:hypothetical protein
MAPQPSRPCVNKVFTNHGIPLRLPNGTTTWSNHTALLDMPQLPLTARQAYIFPDLTNSALISIGQFCDNGYEAHFTQQNVTIQNDNVIVLTGTRDANGLWVLNLKNDTTIAPTNTTNQHATNNVYKHRSQKDIVKYLHEACCSPEPSTWIKAIDAGHFATWPGLASPLTWYANIFQNQLPPPKVTYAKNAKAYAQRSPNLPNTYPTLPIPP